MTESELREHVRDALVEVEPDGTYVYPDDEAVSIAIDLALAAVRRAQGLSALLSTNVISPDDVRVERARRKCRASKLVPAVLLGGFVGYYAAKKF